MDNFYEEVIDKKLCKIAVINSAVYVIKLAANLDSSLKIFLPYIWPVQPIVFVYISL